jgi:hypothetical protein
MSCLTGRDRDLDRLFRRDKWGEHGLPYLKLVVGQFAANSVLYYATATDNRAREAVLDQISGSKHQLPGS